MATVIKDVTYKLLLGNNSYIGPIANPRTKMETTNEASSVFSEWNSLITTGTLGANIDDAKGLERHY